MTNTTAATCDHGNTPRRNPAHRALRPGMRTLIVPLAGELALSVALVLTLLLSAGSVSAEDVSPRCEAAMDRAAGHYSKCLLSADASFAGHDNTAKLTNRQARCEAQFDRRTSGAINRHGADACPSSELVADIKDRTASYAEGVAREAQGKAAIDAFLVQHAEGGTLTESTLTLTDVSRRTGWFAWSGHAREAGELSTKDLVGALQNDAEASASPLIVDFTMESGEEVFHYDLELSDPVYDEESDTLSYTVLSATEDNNGSTGTEAVEKSAQEEIHFEHSQLTLTLNCNENWPSIWNMLAWQCNGPLTN